MKFYNRGKDYYYLIAINDLDKKIVIAEIKLNKDKVNIELLQKKAEKLLSSYQDYQHQWLGLGLDDVNHYLVRRIS